MSEDVAALAIMQEIAEMVARQRTERTAVVVALRQRVHDEHHAGPVDGCTRGTCVALSQMIAVAGEGR